MFFSNGFMYLIQISAFAKAWSFWFDDLLFSLSSHFSPLFISPPFLIVKDQPGKFGIHIGQCSFHLSFLFKMVLKPIECSKPFPIQSKQPGTSVVMDTACSASLVAVHNGSLAVAAGDRGSSDAKCVPLFCVATKDPPKIQFAHFPQIKEPRRGLRSCFGGRRELGQLADAPNTG